MNALDIKNLRKTYASSGKNPPKHALKGVDLAVPEGMVLGLLGPNGAGKSTLINILAGLVVKTSGSVCIQGFDQDINPRQSRAAIGIMPQEPHLDPFFTPRRALDVHAGLYGVPKSERKSDELLALVGLSDKSDAYPRTLSGGMRRRLLMAKALVHSPKILVLDEPTAGVDIALRDMLWENVRKLNQEGMTIILTTHYLEEAQEMCDEIAVINHGEKITHDTTKNLLAQMDTKTLIITPETPQSLPQAPKGLNVETSPNGQIRLSYHSNITTAEMALDFLRAANVVIIDIQSQDSDLEDVFLALTQDR